MDGDYVYKALILWDFTMYINLENLNVDFSKYLLIPNKFRTQWIQRIVSIYELF